MLLKTSSGDLFSEPLWENSPRNLASWSLGIRGDLGPQLWEMIFFNAKDLNNVRIQIPKENTCEFPAGP